jgi:hypothetical protein
VGNRVDEIPGSDSSRFCLFSFDSTVNTPTKKKPQHEIPCYLLVFLVPAFKVKTSVHSGNISYKRVDKIFSVKIFTFLGQNNDFHGPKTLHTIFLIKFGKVKM